jgi:hypothetical protein
MSSYWISSRWKASLLLLSSRSRPWPGAGVETGAVGGLDQDLPVWQAERERALRAEAGSARTTRLSKPRIRLENRKGAFRRLS